MALISDAMAKELMARERDGRGLSATNANKLIAWKRAKAAQGPARNATYNAFSGSSIISPNKKTGSTSLKISPTQAAAKNAAAAAAKAPATPSSQPYAGASSSYGGSYGGSLPPVDPTPQIPINVELYNLRNAQQLMDEASTANKAVYNPKYQGLEALIGQLGQAQDASERDREARYGTQIKDLQNIYGTLNSQFAGAQGAVGQGYDQAAQGIQAATDQGLSQQGRNFARSAQMLSDMTNLAGVGNWAQQGQADLSRDDSFAQALLANTNQQAQGMNSLAKGAANTWLTSLNEGTKAQGAMQSGQAQLARDRDISQIEQEYLGKTTEAQQNLYDTQSQSAADLYELVRGMQSEDWTKYMDTREAAFGQQYQNAGLLQQGQALSLEKAQLEQQALLAQLQAATSGSGSSGSQQTRLDQALNYLGEAFTDPKELQDAQYVMRLLMTPRQINSDISNPAGSIKGGTNFLGLYGDNDAMKAQYGARLYESMKDRGYVTGLDDPSWAAMQNALAILMSGTKKV